MDLILVNIFTKIKKNFSQYIKKYFKQKFLQKDITHALV